jgi:hypothetical protein
VHRLAPYAASVAGLAAVLEPGQPLPADDADDVGVIPPTFPAALHDGDQPEAFGVPERILDRPATYPGPRRDLVNGPVAAATVAVLVRNDSEHRDLGGCECGSQRGRHRARIG